MHGIVSEFYGPVTRPMTLVFAKVRTEESLKEAMFDARTLAYFNNTLAGPEELLMQFFDAAISVSEPYLTKGKYTWVEVTNNSDVPFRLFGGTEGVTDSFTLNANTITTVRIDTEKNKSLEWSVKNMLTAYKEYLRVTLK